MRSARYAVLRRSTICGADDARAGIQPQSSATAESTTAQATTAHVVESQNGSSADATSTTDVSADKSSRETADRLFAEGNKSLALKKLEEAVAKFADALEVM